MRRLAPFIALSLSCAGSSTSDEVPAAKTQQPLSSTSRPRLFVDLEPGGNDPRFGSRPSELLELGGIVYISASDGSSSALFAATQTTPPDFTVTKLATFQSGPYSMRRFPSATDPTRILFIADDGLRGAELWTSSGTPATTRLVRDIRPGAMSSGIWELTVVNETFAAFSANDGTHSNEPWTTDGTAAGTRLALDIDPLGDSIYMNGGMHFAAFQNRAYFTAASNVNDVELWMTDGMTTSKAFDLNTNSPGGRPVQPAVHNGRLYVGYQRGPNTAHDTQVVSVGPGGGAAQVETALTGGAYVSNIASNGTNLFFQTSTAGSYALNVRPGGTISLPGFVSGWDSAIGTPAGLYFINASTSRLWFSNGTTAGESPGGQTVSVVPKFVSSGSGQLAFIGRPMGETEYRLFHRPAYPTGTAVAPTEIMAPGGGRFADVTTFGVSGSRIFFSGNDGQFGAEPWLRELTISEPVLIADLLPSGASSDPTVVAANSRGVVFVASRQGTPGRRLWFSDGLLASTIRPAMPGRAVEAVRPPSGSPAAATLPSGDVVFSLNMADAGEEPAILRFVDGTVELLADVNAGDVSSSPMEFFSSNGRVWFSAIGAGIGRELFVTDGTTAGTRLVANITAGASPSNPMQFQAAPGGVVFSIGAQYSSRALWRSDGTDAGTGPSGSPLDGGPSLPQWDPFFDSAQVRHVGTDAGIWLPTGAVFMRFLADGGRSLETAPIDAGIEVGFPVTFVGSQVLYVGGTSRRWRLYDAVTQVSTMVGPDVSQGSSSSWPMAQRVCTTSTGTYFIATGASNTAELIRVSAAGQQTGRWVVPSQSRVTCFNGDAFVFDTDGNALRVVDATVDGGTRLAATFPSMSNVETMGEFGTVVNGVMVFRGASDAGVELWRWDLLPPTLTCPSDVNVMTDMSTGTVATFTVDARDNVDGFFQATTTPASGSNFPVGTTAVTAESTDLAGNRAASCSFNVTVTYVPPEVDAGLDAGDDAGFDAGVEDAGLDAGVVSDAGVDAGRVDAGRVDSGISDAGVEQPDGGARQQSAYRWPGCSTSGAGTLLPLGLLVLLRGRRRFAKALVLLTVGLSTVAMAGEKPKLAVTGVRALSGVTQGEADVIAERVVSALRSLDAYEVISSSDVAALLGAERQRELMGCSANAIACSAEIANALNAERLLMASASRLGDSFLLDVTLLDAQRSRALGTVSRKYSANRIDSALDDLPAVAAELARFDGVSSSALSEGWSDGTAKHWEVGARLDVDTLDLGIVPAVSAAYATRYVSVVATGIISARPGGRLEGRVFPIRTKFVWPYVTLGATVFGHGLGLRAGGGLQVPILIARLGVDLAYERFVVKSQEVLYNALLGGLHLSFAF